MGKPLDIIKFGEEPTPPLLVYKYLSPERVTDVLANQTVRFMRLLDTNDSFEVRATFRQFAGPRFIKLMEDFVTEKTTEVHVDKALARKLDEIGMGSMPPVMAKILFKKKFGKDLSVYMKDEMKARLPALMEALNAFQTPEDFLNELGSSLLCFSLSETYISAPMWAHYAVNHTGFVLEFDTGHPWFQHTKDKQRSLLRRVKYVDGQLDEAFDDPHAAFGSKTLDWAYEKEWRVYCGFEHVEKTVGSASDPIHLKAFPADAVTSIIIGHRATDATVAAIKAVAQDKYAHCKLLKASANRTTHSFDLTPLQ